MAKSNFIVRGGADFSEIRREFDSIKKRLDKFQASANKTMSGIGKAFKWGLGYLSARAIKGFVKVTTELASDLTEIQNVTDTVFQSMSDRIDGFSKSLLDSHGLTELTAKKYSSYLGAMLKSTGLGLETVTEMSENLTMRIADTASFYNKTTDEMYQKVMSGMSGMTQPLKELGINMNIANLEAFALSQGIRKSWQEMTYAEQTLLRYNYFMAMTKDTQGDFARNSYTWANQLKLLTEQWNILKVTLGAGFINALMPVVKLLNTIIRQIQVAAEYFRAFTAMLFGDAEAGSLGGQVISDTVDYLEDMQDGFGGVGNSAKKAAKEIKGALAGFDEINLLNMSQPATGGTGGGIGGSVSFAPITAGTSVWDKAAKKIKPLEDTFKNLTKNIKPLQRSLERLKKAIEPFKDHVGDGLKWFYDKVLKPVSEITITEVVPEFIETSAKSIELLNTAIDKFRKSGAPKVISDFVEFMSSRQVKGISRWFKRIGDAVDRLRGFIEKPSWSNFKNTIIDIYEAFFASPFSPTEGFLAKTLEYIFGFDLGKWYEKKVEPWLHKDKWKDITIEIRANVATKWRDIKKSWNDLVSNIKDETAYFKARIETKWSDIKTSWTNLTSNIKDKTANFKARVATKWSDLSSTWGNLANNIKDKTANFKARVATTWSDLRSRYNNLVNNFKGKVVDFKVKLSTSVGSVKNFVNSLIDSVNRNLIAKLDFKFRIPSLFGGGTWSWRAPRIPKLDTGTNYVPKDMLAIIHEGEAVIPKEFNPYAGGQGMIGNNRPIELTLQIGETKLGRVVIDSINKLQKQEGRILLEL